MTKVAPEHISDAVLRRMGKPENAVYQRFLEKYKRLNKELGKNQFVVRRGEKTLPVLADPVPELFFTGGMPEVCGGAAHIVKIALEIRIPGQKSGLLQNGFMASGLHRPSLMKGQSAEAAPAKAAPVADQGKLDLRYGRHASLLLVGGMPGAHVGYRTRDLSGVYEPVILPSFEKMKKDSTLYAKSFAIQNELSIFPAETRKPSLGRPRTAMLSSLRQSGWAMIPTEYP